MKLEQTWVLNSLAVALAVLFLLSVIFTTVNGAKLYSLSVDYIWKIETCTYPRIAETREEVVEECKYDGSRAGREATLALGGLIFFGLASAWSYRSLRRRKV